MSPATTRNPFRNHPTDTAILIVEDERPARAELSRMLRQLGVTGVIREAGSVAEALSAVLSDRPDLMLLDIQMPGGSGFDLLGKLGPDHPPVIFTTAHEHFAARAFEEDAVDYLLKPFDPARLAKALSRLPGAESKDTRLGRGDVVLLKIDGECELIPVDQIELIEATEKGTLVHWGKSFGIVNRTLQQLSERLDPILFFRCSRDVIVNIGSIVRTHSDAKGSLAATLHGGREITFSRRRGSHFRNRHGA